MVVDVQRKKWDEILDQRPLVVKIEVSKSYLIILGMMNGIRGR